MVVRERRSHLLAHHRLDRGVGLGHDGAIGLVADLEILTEEQPHADLAGAIGEPVRERELVLVHAASTIAPAARPGAWPAIPTLDRP